MAGVDEADIQGVEVGEVGPDGLTAGLVAKGDGTSDDGAEGSSGGGHQLSKSNSGRTLMDCPKGFQGRASARVW